MMHQTHKSLFLPITTLLVACVLAACAGDPPPMSDSVSERDSMPVLVTRGISKLITDSGVMRYKIISEEWKVFDKTMPPRWEFNKGLYLQRYDDHFKVNMYITADSATLYDQKTWKLRGNVRLHDFEAQTSLVTEELVWNMQSGEMASNVYSKLSKPEEEIEGNWFRATVVNKNITSYHIRQGKGFMPMSDPVSTDAPAPAANDTIDADSIPHRSGPQSHPVSRERKAM